jgi:xyloglucan-specific exo-beta-1,4-glucanase
VRNRNLGALAALGVLAGMAGADVQPAQAASSYKNVQIVGGGFICGIVFNQTTPNVCFARTDIGGLYRWDNANNKWLPLLDWVGWDNWGYSGVASVATDPVNSNVVYAAVGGYTNSWDTNNGAILKSTDLGNTWTTTPLPFKLGGNDPGRGAGERLQIDPNNNNVLYLGAPNGNGLWRSTNAGGAWAQVTSFPNAGNYVQDPTDPNGYLSGNQGIYWVKFDKSTGTPGVTTQTIYVGVATKTGPSVYVSTNGGSTWAALAGQPVGFLPHQAEIDSVNHLLYIAYSDLGGPYDGLKGDVWKYATATGVWTKISPQPALKPDGTDNGDNFFGYSGLSIDRTNPSRIMVTGYSSWWPDTFIYRSTDQGATWTNAWAWTRYPNRSFKFTLNVTASPWLTFPATPACPSGGRPGPQPNPKLGWMTEALAIDPFNPNRFFYGTGATLFGSDNLLNWDVSPTSQIAISVKAMGIEEIAAQDLISPPAGPPLISAMFDIRGFRHDNIDVVPTTQFPTLSSSKHLDFAQANPVYIVRVGSENLANCEKSLAVSTNSGTSWTITGGQPAGLTGPGTVCVTANNGRIVWSPDGVGVYSSANATAASPTWTLAMGIPAGAIVCSDRVNANKVYGFKAGTFYVSTNGGLAFTATAATGLPATGPAQMKALYTTEGDIWLVGGEKTGTYGMWHSTNSGASFTKIAVADQADTIGFGKAATGQTYPAIYTSAKISGVRGIFRSIDAGATWQRINDDQHQYYSTGNCITGDPRTYGRCYLGTNGRGIICIDTP